MKEHARATTAVSKKMMRKLCFYGKNKWYRRLETTAANPNQRAIALDLTTEEKINGSNRSSFGFPLASFNSYGCCCVMAKKRFTPILRSQIPILQEVGPSCEISTSNLFFLYSTCTLYCTYRRKYPKESHAPSGPHIHFN